MVIKIFVLVMNHGQAQFFRQRQIVIRRKIPLLVMDYDSFDPRVVSAEPIRDKIEQFFSKFTFVIGIHTETREAIPD